MAIALVTHTMATVAGGGPVTTSAIDTTGASLLVLVVSTYGSVPLTSEFSDSKGNTWTALTTRAGGSGYVVIFYSVNPTVGSGHTVSWTPFSRYPVLMFSSWSGVKTTYPFDQEAGASGTGSSLSTGSVTPSENNELLISSLNGYTSGTVSLATSGWAILDQSAYSPANSIEGAAGYKIQTTAGAENPTWSGLDSTSSATGIATFKAEAAATGAAVFDRSRVLDGMTFSGGSIFA